MTKYTMSPWCIVYTAVDAGGNDETHEDGTPVLYLHPHEDLSFVDASDIEHGDFVCIDGLHYAHTSKGGTP